MAMDMSVYFDVLKEIQEQVNRITYASEYSEQERLDLLDRLEKDFTQKLSWAKRSATYSRDYSQQDIVAADVGLPQ